MSGPLAMNPRTPGSGLLPSACCSLLLTLTRAVLPSIRSRTKMSFRSLVSRGTRFMALDQKATNLPFRLTDGETLMAFPCTSWLLTLTSSVKPVPRSWMNTSNAPFVSPGTRLLAKEEKATYLPPALIDAAELDEFPCSPVDETLTRSVVPVWRSRTKMSSAPFVSSGTRLGADDTKEMKRPPMEGLLLEPVA